MIKRKQLAVDELTLPAAGFDPHVASVRDSHILDLPTATRILVATPLGLNGRGGIDRLNDMIFNSINAQPDLKIEVRRLVTRGGGGLFAAQFIFAFALLRLLIAKLSNDVDILHIHLSNQGSSYRKTILGALAYYLGIPYVVHLHGSGFDEFWSATNNQIAGALETLFERSAQVIVLGRYWADAIVSRVPSAVGKLTVLPNATPPASRPWQPSEDGRIRITFLGQLGQRKGAPLLIEAFARLSKRNDWHAIMAGDGDLEVSRAQTARLGISDRVVIPGWLDSATSAELLSKTDILVLPTFSENLPMSILEGFSYGVAVVSTPVGAIREVIDHERNGLLIPPGDLDALTGTLARLIDDQDMRLRLGAEARKDHALHYDINAYVRRISGIWQAISLS